jgi:hypothetical protein
MLRFLGWLARPAAIAVTLGGQCAYAQDNLICPSGYHKEWAKLCILDKTEHLSREEPIAPIFDGTGQVWGDQPVCHMVAGGHQRHLVVIGVCATDHPASD